MQADFYGRRPRGQDPEPAAVTVDLGAEDPGGAAQGDLRLRPGRLLPANEAVMVVSSAHPVAGPRLMRQAFEVTELLEQWCGEGRYPQQLVRVLRWDDTPGAQRLLCSWRGHRVDALPPGMTLAGPRLRAAARDLFTALGCLHEAGLAHGAVTLDRLWWDELAGLQLAGLEHALSRGSSEDRYQDVRAAGRLLYHLATGEDLLPGEQRSEIQRRLGLLDPWPARMLTDILVRERPPAADVLVRKLSPPPAPSPGRHSAEYDRALTAFDELRARQRRFRSEPVPRRPLASLSVPWRPIPPERRVDQGRPPSHDPWDGPVMDHPVMDHPGVFRRGVRRLRTLVGLSLLLAVVTR
ncbi:hypothetical protein [Kitasatospora sp. NPDC056181]|uniref:hypothetical protein n=1 Tax=Kitasatospora sp. NPDC056181 TaxID=3345737 RepID=UPI0035DE4B5B